MDDHDEITECPLESCEEDDCALPVASAAALCRASSSSSTVTGATGAADTEDPEDASGAGARPKTQRPPAGTVHFLQGLPRPGLKDQSHGARATNPGHHHRSMFPFFCCGSEVSLISLMDSVDLNGAGRGRTNATASALPRDIEDRPVVEPLLPHSRSCNLDLAVACGSVQTVCGVGRASGGTLVRRIKTDKGKTKKGFWSLRFRNKFPGGLKFSHMRRAACSECGSKKCNASRVPPCDFMCEKGKACPCRKLSYQCAAAELARRQGRDRRASFAGVFPISGNDELLSGERSLERVGVGVRALRDGVLRFSTGGDEASLSHILPVLRDLSHERLSLADAHRDYSSEDAGLVHTSVDYIHHLVPDLHKITTCSFYWGVMDRYEAERLLDKKREGTFLLRDR